MLHDASPTAPSRGWLSRALARFAAPVTPPDAKASRTGPLIALEGLREPVWSPRDYAAFAREGMMQNAIVYRAVRMVAEAAASVPLLLYDGDMEIETHPLLDLLARPNPVSTRADLLEAWYGALLVSGNAYLEAVAVAGELRELHALRADRTQVIPGPDGWPEGYAYTANGESVHFIADVVEGVRPILHLKFFHPANDHYGLSPLEAAATAIDIHNTASRWNKALLDNSARPSGALVYTARDGNLSPDQFERLKSELEAGFQGAAHAGRPMLLEGGLDWKSMSLSPKDMDFIEAKHVAAREIALALGVPPMLLGIPGDNTYSNYQEATRTLWRQTVLPLVTRTAHALSAWLAPAWNEPLALRPDLDAIDALSPERDAHWSRLEKTTFLTPDEKRAAIGYAPLGTPGHKYRADQPRNRQGEWTRDGGASAGGLGPVEDAAPGDIGDAGASADALEAIDASPDGAIASLLASSYVPNGYGWHDYTAGPNLICSPELNCSKEEIADHLSRYSVPGRSPAAPAEDGTTYFVRDPFEGLPAGWVRTRIENEGLKITNETQLLHVLYNGQITREAYQTEDGAWYVITRGIGNNVIPAMGAINQHAGPVIFGEMDARLAKNIELHHGLR